MPPTNYTPAGGLTECLVLLPTLSSHEGCSRVVPPFPSFLSARRCHSQQQHRHLTRMVEEERADNHNPRAKHPCSVPSSAGFGNPPCSGHVRASTDVVTDRRQKRSRSPPPRKIASGLSRSPGWADGISRRSVARARRGAWSWLRNNALVMKPLFNVNLWDSRME